MAAGETYYFWCKERKNHVAPVQRIHFRVKDPTRFGMTTRGPDGIGEIVEIRKNAMLGGFKPTSLEISGAPSPTEELFEVFGDILDTFLGSIQSIKLSGNPHVKIQRLNAILDACKNSLKTFEYSDTLGAEEIEVLAEKLACTSVTGLEVTHSFTSGQLEFFFKKCRSLRALRFSAPPGMNLEELLSVAEPCPTAEFVGFHELSQTQPSVSVRLADLDQFVQKLFPRLRYLYMDWNVIDTELEVSDQTKPVLESLAKLLKTENMRSLFLLIYTPTDDHKAEAEKVGRIFKNVHNFPTALYSFGTKQSGGDNFVLIVVGKSNSLERVEDRIIRAVVEDQNSLPDVRHFLFALEEPSGDCPDNFPEDDLTLEFGGHDKAAVLRKFKERPQIDFVTDEAERIMNTAGLNSDSL